MAALVVRCRKKSAKMFVIETKIPMHLPGNAARRHYFFSGTCRG
jgi:hypothetical protein